MIPTASDLGLCERTHSIGCVLMNFSLLMAAYWGYMYNIYILLLSITIIYAHTIPVQYIVYLVGHILITIQSIWGVLIYDYDYHSEKWE